MISIRGSHFSTFAGVTAIVGIVHTVGSRPSIERTGPTVGALTRGLSLAFVLVVIGLALPLVDGYDNPKSIWPGPLSLISAQGFSVFFLSLAVSAAPLVLLGRSEATRLYGRAGLVLSGAILLATLVFIGRFDFADHPGGLLYVGLYVAVFAVTAWQLVSDRRLRQRPEDAMRSSSPT